MAVTQITAVAEMDRNNNKVVNVAGQCFARPGTPAAGNVVFVKGDWGASAHTKSTQNYGSYGARLDAPGNMQGHTVTCQANGASVTAVVR